jgi:hypothetical protein
MQLGSIELLHINAQALHNVKITKFKSYRRLCNRCLPCSSDGGLVSMKIGECCPLKSSLIKSGVRTYRQCHA